MTEHTPEKLKLKRAFAEVVKGAGGVEASAGFCRVGKSVLSDQSRPESESFPAIDVVADLEPLARNRPGWPHITRELAGQLGFALVKLPEALPDGADLLILLGGLGQSFGQVSSEVCDALSDGRVQPPEATRIRALLRQQIEIAVRMDAVLAAIEGGDA